MTKVYVKVYHPYTMTGKDFAPVKHNQFRRTIFSPDNRHTLAITEMRDGCLCISNEQGIAFEFTISRNKKQMASVKYNGEDSILYVNTNWRIMQNKVDNREIHRNPDLYPSPNLNIDMEMDGVGRVDLKIDESGCAACVFSNTELLFIRMNGNHVVPRLEGFIENEKQRANEAAKDEIGKKYLDDWISANMPDAAARINIADLD